jgi:PPOX class probable F420-dependent enzyme
MTSPAFLALGDESFISLTTFRKSGVGVSTPVWIAREGEHLIVTTPSHSGKVKRLRKNARVEIRPSSRMGKVKPDAPVLHGTAEIIEDPAAVERMGATFLAKYKLEYRIFLWIERRGKHGQAQRYKLVITEQ